jgi:hypothetical protein
MIIEIFEFNRQRNGLEYNEQLEKDMLLEEVREFWEAETVAERVDAYIDTIYVYKGSQIKASYNGKVLPTELADWVEYTISLMENFLRETLKKDTAIVLHKALDIVIKANQLKGNALDENGKVFKDEEYKKAIDATKQIEKMIEEVTTP